MKDDFTRKKRAKHRESANGLAIGLAIGGGLIVLLTIGGVLYAVLGKSRSKDGDGGNVFGIDMGSPKLTEAAYQEVKDGATPADLEALLGKGRTPTTDDFDAIFGKPDPNLYMDRLRDQRALWEENTRRGVVWAWRNGEIRMMVTFSNPPDKPGYIIAKLLRHADGSVSMSYGSGPPQPEPKANTNPSPKTNTPPPPKLPMNDGTVQKLQATDLLAEFVADRNAANAKYRGKRVTITGTAEEIQQNAIVLIRGSDGKSIIQVRLDGVAQGAIGRKKAGDTLTFTGSVQTFFPQTNMLMLQNCSLENN